MLMKSSEKNKIFEYIQNKKKQKWFPKLILKIIAFY